MITELAAHQWVGTLDDRWTIGAQLAHLAFWDRFVRERWEHADRTQLRAPVAVDLGIADFVNDASFPGWLAIPPRDAAALALAAGEETDRIIAALDDDRVEAVLQTGPLSLLDRSIHRAEHLTLLERATSDAEPIPRHAER